MNHSRPFPKIGGSTNWPSGNGNARPEPTAENLSENNISMCGVLPAVIVMETLIRRGHCPNQRTGYAPSAETTGDSSRVVGYAGMLLG
ncbi:MAG: hypothetical protein Ct9H300mP1_32250 [Planctomycetaceae bacterium]|nr:MAG: hypothetical protein Ct9H300mP1_32250 [Planctomycetaceae bacterium]